MFAEEREPEDEAPEGAPPEEGVPGEPGESTPEEPPAAEGESAPEGEADAEGEAAPDDESAGEAVGPEIEGAEALSGAATEGEGPAAEGEPPAEGEERERRPRRERSKEEAEEEVIPGMHLEPDLVLEEQAREESEFGQYAEADTYGEEEAPEESLEESASEPAPVEHTPLDLAADARYRATGKRKSAVARVILKPGEGTYSVNGRHLDEYFPRVRLQRVARQPLEAAGYNTRMDVVARIHGGGVAAQATALRHGIARALVEADPALRGELKRRGYLTRDPRVKERKKAGLKKARKRPQFSKR
jgi:small subunit ribosomal protein S9